MTRPTFTAEQQKWFRGNGFRLLKTKAEGPFGDKRHLLVYMIMKQPMDDKYFIYVLKMTPRYSIGPSIKLPANASVAALEKAQKEMRYNVETLGSVLAAAIEEARQQNVWLPGSKKHDD